MTANRILSFSEFHWNPCGLLVLASILSTALLFYWLEHRNR